MEGSWFKLRARESALVAEQGAKTPSEHCQGTLDQGTVTPNSPVEPCDELLTFADMVWNRKEYSSQENVPLFVAREHY